MKHPWFDNIHWDYIYHKRYESLYLPKIKGDLGLSNFDEEFREITPVSLEGGVGPFKKVEGFSYEAEMFNKTKKESRRSNLMEVEEENK